MLKTCGFRPRMMACHCPQGIPVTMIAAHPDLRDGPMAQRPLLKADHWATLLGAPSDEETLIRHYTLGQADLDLIRAKATAHNQLGLAIQPCLMRHLGRSWRHDEVPPAALVTFIAHQIDVPSIALREYGRRRQNRREHALEVQRHLGLRQVDKHDLRAASPLHLKPPMRRITDNRSLRRYSPH